MFNQPGRTIKAIAIIAFISESLAAIVGAIITMSAKEVGLGFLVLLGGPVAAYLVNVFIYGFGELIESTMEIRDNTLTTALPKENNNALAAAPSKENNKALATALHKAGNEKSTQLQCPFCGEKLQVSELSMQKETLSCPLCGKEFKNIYNRK